MSSPPQCFDLACVNEVVPVSRSEKKKRGLGTGQCHIPARWLVGFLISFFFFFFFSLLFEFCLVRFNQ